MKGSPQAGDVFGDAPFTNPAKDCTLPSHGIVQAGSTPNELAIDRMIEKRYGKPTDDMTGMKPTGNKTEGFLSEEEDSD